MRRKLPAPTIDNDIFSRSCQSGILGHRLSNARLQQMLLVLLLLTGGMVLWMGNNRVWPDLHLLLVTHPGFTPHIGALAASSSTSNSSSSAGEHARAANLSSPATVTQPALQPQTLQALGESLEFPIWWHAPFISQSGGLLTAADCMHRRLLIDGTSSGCAQLAETRARTAIRHNQAACWLPYEPFTSPETMQLCCSTVQLLECVGYVVCVQLYVCNLCVQVCCPCMCCLQALALKHCPSSTH